MADRVIIQLLIATSAVKIMGNTDYSRLAIDQLAAKQLKVSILLKDYATSPNAKTDIAFNEISI